MPLSFKISFKIQKNKQTITEFYNCFKILSIYFYFFESLKTNTQLCKHLNFLLFFFFFKIIISKFFFFKIFSPISHKVLTK